LFEMASRERSSKQVASQDSGKRPEHSDDPAVADGAPPERPRMVEKLLRRKERHRQRSKAYRVAWVTAGILVIVGGLAIGVLPGPGPVILVPLGLAMLALEYVWAERLLERALIYANRAKEGVTGPNAWQKMLAVGLALLLVAATYAVAAWLWEMPGPMPG